MTRRTNTALGVASGMVLAVVGLAWVTSNPQQPAPDINPPAPPNTPVSTESTPPATKLHPPQEPPT